MAMLRSASARRCGGASTSASASLRPRRAAARAAVAGATDAKATLLSKLSYVQRSEANELLLQLEREGGAVEQPVGSKEIEGAWRFQYMGSVTPGPIESPTRPIALLMYAGGFTPGELALQYADKLPKNVVDVSEMTLNLAGSQSTVTADCTLFGQAQKVVVKTEISMLSGRRMRETYKAVEAFGREVELPEALRYERELLVTYLDEDLLIARDATGSPDVLVRVMPESSASAESEAPAAGATQDKVEPEEPLPVVEATKVEEPEADAKKKADKADKKADKKEDEEW